MFKAGASRRSADPSVGVGNKDRTTSARASAADKGKVWFEREER
jgi:hypothetical protein